MLSSVLAAYEVDEARSTIWRESNGGRTHTRCVVSAGA